mmetsp:Transcript_8146/g.10645  ORF Transcript_8146/g.10645 Transcript_8146/m.10645 type:complete len:308 (+) Transcript_8146:136-1059(+)
MGSTQSAPQKAGDHSESSGVHIRPDDAAFDRLATKLPNVIDDESRQQVEDYRQACNNGKGTMAACFATGEYLSLYERKHKEAVDLYRNVCFRDKKDKSPNGILVDGTMAYPTGCFNLAKMTMTGKGVEKADNAEGYRLMDRSCRSGHGGACFLQAKILGSKPGSLGADVPHDVRKAMQLYEQNCVDLGDSVSCFELATLLLRGDKISNNADNATPQEAQGLEPVKQRSNEKDREKKEHENQLATIPRDAKRAEELLKRSCDTGSHVTSCHNLAVMYYQGDDGVPADPEKAEKYGQKTESMMNQFGGF